MVRWILTKRRVLVKDPQPLFIRKVQECYSLKELASAVGVDSDSLAEKLQTDQHKQLNDHVAKAFMEALCNSIDPNLTVECNVEVEGMRYLPTPT